MLMLRSTHEIIINKLKRFAQRAETGAGILIEEKYMDIISPIYRLWPLKSEVMVLKEKVSLRDSQIESLEKQLKEAKRRQSNGRFVSAKEVDQYEDFLTRS